jgi:glyoxylase-like metal-dependent hydrolase (beta-lactamase superfamily II)
MQVVGQIYRLSGLFGAGVWGANVFLLADYNGNLTLIDTGFKGRARHILRQIEKVGHSPLKVSRIIITHHHLDHIGSLALLKEYTKAHVLAHAADAPYITGQMPQPGPLRPAWLNRAFLRFPQLLKTAPVAVDEFLKDGDELPVLGGMKVYHTPGHTPGSICLYLKKKWVVIAGDLVSNRFGLRLPSRQFTADLAQEIDSIKRIAALDFDILCVGHGAPVMGGAHRALKDLAERLAKAQAGKS